MKFSGQNMPVVGGGYFDLLEIKSCLKQMDETSKKEKHFTKKGVILNNNHIGRRWGTWKTGATSAT